MLPTNDYKLCFIIRKTFVLEVYANDKNFDNHKSKNGCTFFSYVVVKITWINYKQQCVILAINYIISRTL
jgi:hypothetical protein